MWQYPQQKTKIAVSLRWKNKEQSEKKNLDIYSLKKIHI